MALDFPSSPLDGQVFGNFIWAASPGVWRAKPNVGTIAIPSSVAPTAANNGDVWFDTTKGISFVYYNDGTSSQWVEMLSSSVPAVTEIMPSGSVIQTARATAPTGWLLCQGQAVSRSTYSLLYAAIGTAYGVGDGVTTFTLPDLQGRIPVGKNAGTFSTLNSPGGVESVTLTQAQTPSHTHTYSGTSSSTGDHTHTYSIFYRLANDAVRGVNGDAIVGGQYSGTQGYYNGIPNGTTNASSIGNHSHTVSGTTASAGSDGAHSNLQPYIVMNYMIKV